MAADFSSSQPAENIGRDSEHAFEGARKVKLVAETGALGNLLDQRAGLLKQFGGEVHFEAQQELVWAFVIVALEQAAQVGGVHMAFLRNLTQRLEPLEIFFDVLVAMLVGCERKGFNAGARRV